MKFEKGVYPNFYGDYQQIIEEKTYKTKVKTKKAKTKATKTKAKTSKITPSKKIKTSMKRKSAS